VRPISSQPDPGGWSAGVFSSSGPEYTPRWWLHGLLLGLTLITTTFWGAAFAGDLPEDLLVIGWPDLLLHPRFIFEGLKFSLPLLIILMCHEMGHYLACRRHGLLVTPPFFIPFPLPIGTLGAVIRIKEPITSRRQLMDIGASGPIAGFVAAIPFLLLGLRYSTVQETPDPLSDAAWLELGEPLVYRLLDLLVHSDVRDGMTVMLHPTGFAAWCGLLVTLLNMLPFAQLDGGHVSYALFGRWHRRAAWPMLVVLVAAGFAWGGWWVWSVIVVALGVHHPPVWDERQPLDRRHIVIGVVALLIFVLCFMPVPIKAVP